MNSLSLCDANEMSVHPVRRSPALQPLIEGWHRSLYLMEDRRFTHGAITVTQVAVGSGYILCLLRCDGHFLCPLYLCWHESISSAAWEAAEQNLTVAATEYGAGIRIAWPPGPPPPTPWVAILNLENLPGTMAPPPGGVRANALGIAWALIEFFGESEPSKRTLVDAAISL